MKPEINKQTILNFQLEKDRIIVRKSSSSFFPENDDKDILEEILLSPNYEGEILDSITKYLKNPINNSYRSLLENMMNYDLNGFNIYFRILGFKSSLQTTRNYYEYYVDSKLTVDLSGSLIETGIIDMSEAVILVTEVFDLFGVVDFVGWGTWVRFLIENEQWQNQSIISGTLNTPQGELDININGGVMKSFDLPTGGSMKISLGKETTLYGTLANNFVIDSLSGILVLDTRVEPPTFEVNMDNYMLIDDLMMQLGIKQFFGSIRLAPPKLTKVDDYTFHKFIGEKSKVLKNISERLAPNDILAEVEEYNINEIYDLTEMVSFESPNEIMKYVKVLNGELVTRDTLIFSKPNYSGFSDLEIRSQSTGIVDLNSLLITGEVKILGGKSTKKIECGMHGKMVGITNDGYAIISDEGYQFLPRFINFANVMPINASLSYLTSLKQINTVDFSVGEWVAVDVEGFELFKDYLKLLESKNVGGIIMNHIPLEYYEEVQKRNIKLVLINGFGKDKIGIRYDIAFSRSNCVQIQNNIVTLGV